MATTQNFEEIQNFGKQQIEAITATSSSLVKGLQEIATESVEYSKNSFAASSAVVEKLLGAKTVESAIAIQTEFAKFAYEKFVTQATKVSELYLKLAKETFKPVQAVVARTQGK